MARSEFHYFQGKAAWAKLHTPDVEYKSWNVKVYLTPDSYNKFMELKEDKGDVTGILNDVKQEEDGYSVIFRRPTEKTWGGQVKILTPPIVVDKDGQPFTHSIGNGSDITVKVERYQYNKPFKQGKGTAIRLVGARVDNLIPYQRSEFTAAEEKQIKGLDGQPAQLF